MTRLGVMYLSPGKVLMRSYDSYLFGQVQMRHNARPQTLGADPNGLLEGSRPAVVFVAVAKAAKGPRVVPDDHRVHALGHSDLPSIVLAHAMGGTALA